MTADDIINDLLRRYDGTIAIDAWGETSLFFNPNGTLPRGVYFATVKQKNGENDKASDLNRDGAFRLNIGTTKQLFVQHFGPPPARPSKGGIVQGGWDFTALDVLNPHPVYGWMCWVCVLNPTQETFTKLGPLVDAAYAKAEAAYAKKVRVNV